jgi:hypothetical protein
MSQQFSGRTEENHGKISVRSLIDTGKNMNQTRFKYKKNGHSWPIYLNNLNVARRNTSKTKGLLKAN